MGHNKRESISSLSRITRIAREADWPVVHCHGVFDLLHIGHIRYLERSSGLGRMLVVTVTPDRFVNKGPLRPAFSATLRAEAIAALVCVDYVAINEWPTASKTIEKLKPAIFAKGAEFRDKKTPMLLEEEAAAEAVGTEIVFIDDVTSSSAYLLDNHLDLIPANMVQCLNSLREHYSAAQILDYLARMPD